MKRRVVITGIGVVSAAGVGIDPLWRALESGTSAIKNCSRFDASGFASHLVGEARDGDQPFSAKDHVPKHYRKAVKVMSKDVELAVASAKLAVEQAGLVTRAKEDAPATYPPERTSCHIGAGLIAAETEELSLAMSSSTDVESAGGAFSLKKWGTAEGGGGGMNNLQPLWMLKYLPNMLACHVTIIHGLEGPSNTLLNGEASGLLSLGESLRIIQRGAADAGLAGSAESKVNPMGLLRLDLCGRVAHTNADASPESTVRPYAKESTGGLVGEAGGIVVVEDETMAQARGVRIHARVAGFGAAHALVPPIPILSSTCGHACPTTKFDPAAVAAAGRGLARAITSALRDAGLTPADIDAAIPEGCGAPLPDQAEAFALREVFGPRAETLPLICPSPIIGGCAAGNGGVQAALGAHCLSTQSLPRTHRLDGSTAPAESRNGSTPLRRILLCSMGVCGQCAAIVLEA